MQVGNHNGLKVTDYWKSMRKMRLAYERAMNLVPTVLGSQ